MSTLPHAVTALAACSDGATLAIGLASGKLLFWDMAAGKLHAERLAKSGSRINTLRCSPAGDLIAVAADDGTITTWDPREARPRERFDLPGGRALGLCFTEDGARLAVVGQTGYPHVFDVVTGELVFADTAKHGDGSGFTIALSEDRLFVGFRSGFVGYWSRRAEPPHFERPKAFRIWKEEVYALATMRRDPVLVAGLNSGGGVLFVRFPEGGDWPPVGKIKVPRPMAVNALAISPHELQVAAACSDGVVRVHPLKIPSEPVYDGAPYTLFESTLGREVHRDWTPRAIVSAVAFLGDDLLASGHFDGHVRFWRKNRDVESWDAIATLRTDGSGAVFAYEGRDETLVVWGDLPLRPGFPPSTT